MNRIFSLLSAWVLLAAAATVGSAQEYEPATGIRLEQVASGLSSPLYLTAPAADSRLFVVEQPGRIRIVRNGELLPTPFLNIVSRVGSGGERGLLSVAFHRDYATNGFFYVNYTNRSGDTVIERYSVSADADVADPASGKVLLTVDQPFANHNGGHIMFGPDNMLYIAMGDGGGAGDPQDNGQDRLTLLGKMLRIDVDSGDPYAIPADNPFTDQDDALGEIWALGLRNPWRFAFDRTTNLLYIADVGQGSWEEINIVPAKDAGLNYGWNIMEGTDCYGSRDCDQVGLVLPVVQYSHAEGCSVTGGYVYRGTRLPSVVGHYFFSDYCDGWVRSFKYDGGAVSERREWNVGSFGRALSFGEDAAGELYVLSSNGRVYRMVPAE